MNLISKIKGMKLVALFLAALTCIGAAAENRIYIEPFNIVDESPVDVPVLMNNDTDIYAVQFSIQLPDELELVGEPERDPVRLSNGQEITFRGIGVMVNSWEGKPIAGNSGAIMTIRVKAKAGMLENKAVSLGLSKIVMADANNKKVNPLSSQSFDVILGEQPEYVFSVSQPEAVVSAGNTYPVEVCMNNNFALGGMQFLLKMPEGFDIVNTDIKLSNRLSLGTRLRKTVRPDGSMMFVVNDMSSVKIAEAGEGPLFILYVKVPEGYNDYEGKLTVSNVEASTVPDASGRTVSVDCNGFEVKIVNGGRYLSDAEAVVAGLRSDLAAALTTIAAEAADVKDNFTGADIAAAIDAIEAAFREAAANATLPADYASIVTEPAEAVSRSISKLIDDAKAAQKAFEDEAARQAANAEAYKNVSDQIAALQASLDAMKAKVAENYPDAKVDSQIAAAQSAIDTAKADAAAARDAVATEGTFSYTLDAAAVESLITAIETAANSQRVAANDAAYKAVSDKLDALQAQLDAAKAKVAEKYPSADVTSEVSAAQAAIDKAKSEADAAKSAVATEGKFTYTFDSAAIETLIAAVETSAEAQRVAANDAAYKVSTDEIAALQAALDAMKSKVAAKYPDANVSAETIAAQSAIDKAEAAAANAKSAVMLTGNYSYTVDKEGITALINAIETAAETQRVAANDAAYKAVSDKLDALQASLDAMKTKVAGKYPDANVTAEETAAQTAIDNAKREAAAAKSAVAAEGKFVYTFDSAAIEALIAAVETSAEAQRVAANETAYQASLAEIQRLTDKHNAMKTTVAANYPDADVEKHITAAQSALDKAKNEADAAHFAVKNEGKYSYVVDTPSIEALIEAIRVEAANDQAAKDAEAKRVADNEAAYQASLDEIKRLTDKLNEMKTTVSTTYPDADVDKQEAAAQNALDKAQSAADAAHQAVKNAGTYNYAVDTTSIEALIEAIRTEAAKQQDAKDAEAKRVADNDAAYQASVDEIAALQAALDAMKAKVASKYPDASVTAETVAAQAAIDKAEAGAAAAKSAVLLAGNYSYSVDTEGITALINAIETSAEAQRVAANEAAYQASLAEIKRLTDKLDNMKSLIATTYPDVDVADAIAAAANALTAAKDGADAALLAVKDEGKYSYSIDAAAIEALIDAIRTAAAEAQAALDKENARVDANQAAYDEVVKQLDALQAALDQMKENVSENYPDADVTAEIEAAQAAIDKARADAEQALDDVADEGNFSYSLDSEAIESLIENVETAAKKAGIINIEADTANGVLYFDINGRHVINPERGKVIIRQTPDGQVTKIIL